MSLTDMMLKDDEAHLLRTMLRRLEAVERATRHDVPVGAVMTFPLTVRSNSWSVDREESVGSNWSRWYRFNDINEEDIYEDESGNTALRPTFTGTKPVMGQPGGLTNEGGYSVDLVGGANGMNIPVLTTGQRAWSMEAIFMPDTLPQTQALILFNGSGGNGYGLYISGAGGGSGSRLTLFNSGGSPTWFDLNVLFAKLWYHAIVVADNADNTLKWYLGAYVRPGMIFSFNSGSIAMPTPPLVPTTTGFMGFFDGRLDEALIYNGQIAGGTVLKGAEDRIRTAIQPAAPSGWIPTDGALVARQRYAKLFSVIGESEGAGDGSTTFKLPTLVDGIIKV